MSTVFELLGVAPNASREELQAAYVDKLAQYAPERLALLPDEFQRLAATRRAELQAAYRELRVRSTAPARLLPEAERRRDRETILALLLLVLVGLSVPLARPYAVPDRTAAVTGATSAVLTADLAPDFTAQTLDQRSVSLADYRGSVVLLNFWATWCPPCVRETPRLARVAEAFEGRGLVVLGVNTTFQDERSRVEQFVRDQAIGYQVLLDVDGSVGAKYPARLMPTSYLIDRSGRIVHSKVGEIDEAALMEQVEAILRH